MKTILLKLCIAICLLAAISFGFNSINWSPQKAPLMTKWAADVDVENPLPEYPRPQMVREQWMNLNGLWEFSPGNKNVEVPTGGD
jgi:hypothetical protein